MQLSCFRNSHLKLKKSLLKEESNNSNQNQPSVALKDLDFLMALYTTKSNTSYFTPFIA